MNSPLGTLAALGIACAPLAPLAANVVDGPVGRDAGKGDPARWYQPADTPQKQHQNAVREAAAALAEALRECRAQGGDRESRKRCEADARDLYESDVEQARGLLVRSSLG